jgi:isopentenyl-diphosphate delta-isomerase
VAAADGVGVGVGVGDAVQARKAEHLRLTASSDVNARTGAGWADVRLLHEALPVVDLDAVDLSVTFLGRRLAAPLVIAGMTGGHAEAEAVNACLARAAQRFGLAMGVGSQRAAVGRPEVGSTYGVARAEAPTAFLIGNVGAPQLIPQEGPDGRVVPPLTAGQIEGALALLRADALAVHLNFLQETVQPEGDRRAQGTLEALGALAGGLTVPVIAKETGAGFSRHSARLLAGAGARALDVGGLGGTTFAAVEGLRAAERGDEGGARLGETFREWGIPTAVALVGAGAAGLPMIATGGIRSGLDAAKAIALGADLAGVARPLLRAFLEGGDGAVARWIETFLAELRAAVFLSGARTLAGLRARPRVVLGETREWLAQLGYLEDALSLADHAP